MNKNYAILTLLYLIVISYLLMNTGIFSDDFDAMLRVKGKDFAEILSPKGVFYFVETPVQYFTHQIWYYFFRIYNSTADNIMKMLYISLSFYLISKFFQIYLGRQNALLISFLFIFFPSHDSTVYFFMGQGLTLAFAFYFYSFYLAYKNKLSLSFLLALLASFLSYGSPPLAITLFFLFALNKEFKKGLVLLIPNILYSTYYILLTKVMAVGVDKLAMAKEINIYSIIKLFILQILTFIDAMVGPSMWLKIYYSFSQLSAPSFIIGILVTIIFYKKYQDSDKRYNAKLVLSFLVLMLLSFAMFSVTGHYPQLAFNLGNRSTIFGSLLLAYLIVLIPGPHKLKTLIFALIIFSILGISDHWKKWNVHQQSVITNIRNNQDVKNYQDNKVIYVSGNQYSKYGPISHIEFLSEGWVTRCLFKLLFEKEIQAEPINKRHRYRDGYLIDRKYGLKMKLDSYIYLYDSERDALFKLESEKINGYVDSLPADNRHWMQIMNVKFIKDAVYKLMPRLKYAL